MLKTCTSVKDAFGNDIHVGDQVVVFDTVYGRLAKTHVYSIINKAKIEVVGSSKSGNECQERPYSWATKPYTWNIMTKKVMLCPLDQWNKINVTDATEAKTL